MMEKNLTTAQIEILKIQHDGVFNFNNQSSYLLNRFYYHYEKDISYQAEAIKYLKSINQSYNKILDIGAGYGNIILYCYDNLWDAYGAEINKQRVNIYEKVIDELLYPASLKNKMKQDYVENMSFEDNFFDCIVCFQVLQDLPKLKPALEEMLRVINNNGSIYLTFSNNPYFNCFFSLAWLPIFYLGKNKFLGKIYLKLLNRPAAQLNKLNSIYYVSSNKVIKYLKQIAKENNIIIEIIDLDIPTNWKSETWIYKIKFWAKYFKAQIVNLAIFRKDITARLVIKVKK